MDFDFLETLIQEGTDVLLTEVIEHLTYDDAKKLLQFLSDSMAKNIVVTTPNRDFNKFYDIPDGEMRHEDHQFELTYDMFRELILDTFKGRDYIIGGLGDSVDGIATTSFAVVKR